MQHQKLCTSNCHIALSRKVGRLLRYREASPTSCTARMVSVRSDGNLHTLLPLSLFRETGISHPLEMASLIRIELDDWLWGPPKIRYVGLLLVSELSLFVESRSDFKASHSQHTVAKSGRELSPGNTRSVRLNLYYVHENVG